MARRPLAALLVLGAGALTLTGCILMPPPIPAAVAPEAPSVEPDEPIESDESTDPGDSESAEPTEAAGDVQPNAALGETVTVDDGAGDSWSFAVTSVEEAPPVESGDPEAGTRFVALLLDGQRVEGSFGWIDLFEPSIVGTDGNLYQWSDTVFATAENDVFYVEGDSFTGARALVQLPEGVDAQYVVIRSAYGYPEVVDTVIPAQ
jgi:hypothetical protein